MTRRLDFGRDEIDRFLRAIDRNLAASTAIRVEIIGGAAAAVLSAESTTVDIDTFTIGSAALSDAIDAARIETGLRIPMGYAGAADLPQGYDERLERHLPGLERLEVWVVEKHDLALSKALRCSEHDLTQIAEVHRSVVLDFDVLVERFRAELQPFLAATDPIRARDYFLQMIEYLFGEVKQEAAARLVPRLTGR